MAHLMEDQIEREAGFARARIIKARRSWTAFEKELIMFGIEGVCIVA